MVYPCLLPCLYYILAVSQDTNYASALSAPRRCQQQRHSQFHRTRNIRSFPTGIKATLMKVKGILFVSVAAFKSVPVISCAKEGPCSGYDPVWLDKITAFCAYSQTIPTCCVTLCSSAGCYENQTCKQKQPDFFISHANKVCTTAYNFNLDINGCCDDVCSGRG